MPTRVIINGAKGRMGLALLAAAKETPKITIAAALDQGDDLAAAVPNCDAIIDFSHHSATAAVIELARKNKKALVIGTTGHSTSERAHLQPLATAIPCVWAGNFSIGVNLLFHLTQEAARILDSNYDAEIIEMHHRFKKDAPSGTAARLLEILLEARKLNETDLRHGRSGITGERTKNEIGVHALRGGDVVGDHTVLFAALGERVELTHKASDRSIFARGALHAAIWASSANPGLYDMQDVLGLRSKKS